MWTVPSSSMLISQPVSATMPLMFLPPGPMSWPILSTGILTVSMRGAYWLSSVRGAASALCMTSRICVRSRFASWIASTMIECETPGSFRSSWKPVMPASVPQILKSMSPK